MQIETPRLTIRSFVETDIPEYARIVADPQVTKYLRDGSPHPYEEAVAYVQDAVRRDASSGISRYAVVRKVENDLIGFCGFKELDDYVDFGWRYAGTFGVRATARRRRLRSSTMVSPHSTFSRLLPVPSSKTLDRYASSSNLASVNRNTLTYSAGRVLR